MWNEQTHETDVLIVGGGIAGLRAALAAVETGAKVAIVAKGRGASPDVMGFNAPIGREDSVDTYYNDIMKSGLGINDRKLAKIVAEESIEAIRDMESLGLTFDKDGPYYDLLQPMGCTHPRLAHYKALTGMEICDLIRKELILRGATFIDSTMITSLLVHENAIAGAYGVNMLDGRLYVFVTKAVVLAAGGCGTLYPITTYPSDISSDSYAMAYRAGAELIDMEFVQFEPCTYVYPHEARGAIMVTTMLMAGAELRNANGDLLVKERHRMQKDELSRLIYREICEGRGTEHGGVYFDATMLPRDSIIRNHSISYEPAIRAGLDITREPAEVAPAAHTSLGGIRINEKCEASIEGMYAAGEAAGGVHGANRLGGNAGTGTMVFGKRAGRYAGEYAMAHRDGDMSKVARLLAAKEKAAYVGNPNARNEQVKAVSLRNRVFSIMSEAGNIVRNGSTLRKGLDELKDLEELSHNLYAKSADEVMVNQTVQNMLVTAKVVLTSALMRTESRGAHYRDDFPQPNDDEWLKNVVIRKSNGDINAGVV